MNLIDIKYNSSPSHQIDRKIFGSFIEHIENCIEGGIFDKNSILSDENGIRQDVLSLVKELNPTALRFPGGTVMGIYHWKEHIGPVENRVHRRNIVWGGRMTHEFGTAEFIKYCREIGAEPIICVNMPTGTAEEAADWVEYCNGTGDSYWANLRREHGYPEPFNVKYWCIGNESYAEPDLGTQHDVNVYIRDAWEFTKYMKMTDPEIKLIYVGADENWNRAVLNSFSDVCDYLSIHFYAGGNEPLKDTEKFISDTLLPVKSLIDEFNSKDITLNRWYRIPPRQDKIRIALDEWNIWRSKPTTESPYGLQMNYNWNDALWLADFLNVIIRNSDTIGIANLAQLVNVIAPIKADSNGAEKQSIFFPFSLMSNNCDSFYYPCEYNDNSISVTSSGNESKITRVFAVNHSEEPLRINLPFTPKKVVIITEKNGAVNTEIKTEFTKEIIIDSETISMFFSD